MSRTDDAERVEAHRRRLAERGVSTEALDRLADGLAGTAPAGLRSRLAELHRLADELAAGDQSDYGALVLERVAGRCAYTALAKLFYREALGRAQRRADRAPSGGEGTAEPVDVERIGHKLERLARPDVTAGVARNPRAIKEALRAAWFPRSAFSERARRQRIDDCAALARLLPARDVCVTAPYHDVEWHFCEDIADALRLEHPDLAERLYELAEKSYVDDGTVADGPGEGLTSVCNRERVRGKRKALKR